MWRQPRQKPHVWFSGTGATNDVITDQRRTHQNVTFLDARRDRRDVGKSGGPRVAGRGLAGARGKLES